MTSVGFFSLAFALRAIGLGFGLFAVALAVIVHVPAAAFKLQRRSGDQAFQGSTAFLMYGQRLVREFLNYLKDITARIAFVFVKWHGCDPLNGSFSVNYNRSGAPALTLGL